jgi:hypothetical protein
MLSELICVQPLVISVRGITCNTETMRTTPTVVDTMPSRLEGGLQFLFTTEVGRETGPNKEKAEEVREMGLSVETDSQKGQRPSGESGVRGISFFRFFPLFWGEARWDRGSCHVPLADCSWSERTAIRVGPYIISS